MSVNFCALPDLRRIQETVRKRWRFVIVACAAMFLCSAPKRAVAEEAGRTVRIVSLPMNKVWYWDEKTQKRVVADLPYVAKNEFWRQANISITSPARCFAFYDGTTTAMGGRHFQQWVGCNFNLIKFCCVSRRIPKRVSVQTVLYLPSVQR